MRLSKATATTRQNTRHRLTSAIALAALVICFWGMAAQAQQFWNTNNASASWTSSNWGTSGSGPFTTAWTSGSDARFTANSQVTFATTTVGNVTVDPGITVTVGQAGTLSFTGGSVKTWDVGAGSTLTWTSQTVTANSAAGITKNGTGTLNLGAMTWSTNMNGGFTLNAGTVIVTGNKALGNGALNLNGGTLNSTGGPTFTPTSVIFGGDVAFTGSGNWTMTGEVSLGNTTRTITNTASGIKTFSGNVSGGLNGGITIAGNGSITLSGLNNTYSGGTTVSGGTLSMGSAGALGSSSGSLTVNTGGRLDMGSQSLTVGNLSGTGGSIDGASGSRILAIGNGDSGGGNYQGVISNGSGGTTALTKTGNATITLSGNNTYTGGTTVSGGTLALGHATDTLANTGTVLVNGGTLSIGSNSDTVGAVTLSSGSITGTTGVLTGSSYALQGGTVSSRLGGSGVNLTKSAGGLVTLSGNNTYTGTTSITGGTLSIASTGNINSSSGVTINGGELKYNGSTSLTAPLTFTAGTISGNGTIASALTIGAGTTLSPGNSPGIQIFGGSQTWATSGNYNWQILDAAGTAGTGFDQIQITGTLDVGSGFNLNLWSLSSIGPDVNGNALNFNSASPYSWTIATTTGGILNSGNLSSAVINVGAFNGTGGFSNSLGGGSFSLSAVGNNVVLSFVPVPEPSTFALLGGVATVGLLICRKRRKS